MRAIPDGFEAHFTVTVDEAMTVDFEQDEPGLGRLHPVYATYWLTKHAELASRKIILPFLEAGEEGIGFEVRIRHVASALPGMQVRITARLREQKGNRVYADVSAVNELGDVIGEGGTTQVILPRSALETSFRQLRERWRTGAEPAGEASGRKQAGRKDPT
ncbi:MAG TPA: thioesterase family protein [Trueperaceae bacterium]|nr:thioesterase family protein [Trueperaceae bacterium]